VNVGLFKSPIAYLIGKIIGEYHKRKYYKTINSEKWKEFREQWLHNNRLKYNIKEGYFKCNWCKRILPVSQANLHHTSYKHGLYNKRYIRLICRRCHKWWHSNH